MMESFGKLSIQNFKMAAPNVMSAALDFFFILVLPYMDVVFVLTKV